MGILRPMPEQQQQEYGSGRKARGRNLYARTTLIRIKIAKGLKKEATIKTR